MINKLNLKNTVKGSLKALSLPLAIIGMQWVSPVHAFDIEDGGINFQLKIENNFNGLLILRSVRFKNKNLSWIEGQDGETYFFPGECTAYTSTDGVNNEKCESGLEGKGLHFGQTVPFAGQDSVDNHTWKVTGSIGAQDFSFTSKGDCGNLLNNCLSTFIVNKDGSIDFAANDRVSPSLVSIEKPIVGDFDRDGFSDDLALRRTTDGTWFYYYDIQNGDAMSADAQSTLLGDQLTDSNLSGDFDQDGFNDDIGIFRPFVFATSYLHEWHLNKDHDSSTFQFLSEAGTGWRSQGVTGDFDKDGVIDDFATFAYGQWMFYHTSSTTASRTCDGIGEHYDSAAVGDFDHDGFVNDIVVYRNGTIYFDMNADCTREYTGDFGYYGDEIFVGDFDNDGYIDDIGAYRLSETPESAALNLECEFERLKSVTVLPAKCQGADLSSVPFSRSVLFASDDGDNPVTLHVDTLLEMSTRTQASFDELDAEKSQNIVDIEAAGELFSDRLVRLLLLITVIL